MIFNRRAFICYSTLASIDNILIDSFQPSAGAVELFMFHISVVKS